MSLLEEVFGQVDEILQYDGDLIQVAKPEKYPEYSFGEINLDESLVRVFNEDIEGKILSELVFNLEYKLIPQTPT